jgi:hypothetical protein
MPEINTRPSHGLSSNWGAIGGIIGMLLWFNQPEDLIDVGQTTQWVILGVFIGIAVLLGTALGNLFNVPNKQGVRGMLTNAFMVSILFWCGALGQFVAGTIGAWVGFCLPFALLLLIGTIRHTNSQT